MGVSAAVGRCDHMVSTPSRRRVPLAAVNGQTPIVEKILGTPRSARRQSVAIEESVALLLDLDLDSGADDAEILREAVTSSRKKRQSMVASPVVAWDDEPPSPGWSRAVASLRAEARDRLATAMLRLLNQADEAELSEVLAGIGRVRASHIVQARASLGRPFHSVPEALDAIGLSPKHIQNIVLANMKHILLRH